MVRYFKIIEIDSDSFIEATGEDLECYSQLVVPVNGIVYAAVDDEEDEMNVSMDTFEEV